MVSSLDMHRIQSTSITNVESVIRDDEDDDNRDSNPEEDFVDRSLHNNESDNDNTSESEISSNNFDSDDSFKDPDWKEEIYRKRNKCTFSSDYDSDISISNNPYKSLKRKRNRIMKTNLVQATVKFKNRKTMILERQKYKQMRAKHSLLIE